MGALLLERADGDGDLEDDLAELQHIDRLKTDFSGSPPAVRTPIPRKSVFSRSMWWSSARSSSRPPSRWAHSSSRAPIDPSAVSRSRASSPGASAGRSATTIARQWAGDEQGRATGRPGGRGAERDGRAPGDHLGDERQLRDLQSAVRASAAGRA